MSKCISADSAVSIPACTQVITQSKNPKELTFAHFSRANAYLRTKKFSAAIADYTKAIEFDPKNAAAYFNRSVAKARSNDKAGSKADYDKAKSLDKLYEGRKPISFSPNGNTNNQRYIQADAADSSVVTADSSGGGELAEVQIVKSIRYYTNRARVNDQFTSEVGDFTNGQVLVKVPLRAEDSDSYWQYFFSLTSDWAGSFFGFNSNATACGNLTEAEVGETIDRLKISDEDFQLSDFSLYQRVAPKKEALLYVHGFFNTFENAVCDAAKLGNRFNFGGDIILFSWPSTGTEDYSQDRDRLEGAEIYLEQTINKLLTTENYDVVHLYAHSLGNRLLLRTLERPGTLYSYKHEDGKLSSLGEILLIAPDENYSVYKDRVNFALAKIESQFADTEKPKPIFTLLACGGDKALNFSGHEFINASPRIGAFSPDMPLIGSVETIDATKKCAAARVCHNLPLTERTVADDLKALITQRSHDPAERNPAITKVSLGEGRIYYKWN